MTDAQLRLGGPLPWHDRQSSVSVLRRFYVAGPPPGDRHRTILESVGLPLHYRYDQWPKLLETMKVDKKSRGDLLRFIVLDGLAKPTVLEGPDPAVLLAAYGEVGQ